MNSAPSSPHKRLDHTQAQPSKKRASNGTPKQNMDYTGQPTISTPFKFATEDRIRPSTMKSSQELEDEELERIRGKPLKPRSVDSKVVQDYYFEVKGPTIPQPFEFNIDVRKSQFHIQKEETTSPFKSRPIPKGILEPVMHEFKRRSSIGMKNRKVRVFETTERLTPTIPEPFHLESLERHQKYVEKFEENIKQETLAKKKNACFIAKPLPNTAPFVPLKSTQPLTEVEAIQMNSDRRYQKRTQYEQEMKQRESEIDVYKRETEEEQRKIQQIETVKARRLTVHQARPLPLFEEPQLIIKSTAELTEPLSPLLYTKRRFQKL